MGFPDAELSVTLVDDDRIAELAGDYGRTRLPTDVLAFSLREGPGGDLAGQALGDVILSVETAERQAKARRASLDRELRDLLIHGVLHLLGMDHERADDARRMRELEDHVRWELARAR